MLTAKEAKEITSNNDDYHYKTELSGVLLRIEMAAKAGDSSIEWNFRNNNVENKAVCRLRELGYTVILKINNLSKWLEQFHSKDSYTNSWMSNNSNTYVISW